MVSRLWVNKAQGTCDLLCKRDFVRCFFGLRFVCHVQRQFACTFQAGRRIFPQQLLVSLTEICASLCFLRRVWQTKQAKTRPWVWTSSVLSAGELEA